MKHQLIDLVSVLLRPVEPTAINRHRQVVLFSYESGILYSQDCTNGPSAIL